MAAADVQITAGTGTKIDTRTVGAGVDEHRQVIVVGDPSTASAVASVTAANGVAVDVTRVIPGTTATALGKAEDAAHVDGDTGVLMLGVRNHTGAGADGDYGAIALAADGNVRVDSHKDCVRLQAQSASLTIATTAYSAGDQVGAIFTFANAARVSGGNGVIVGAILTSALDATGPYDVVFFRDTATLAADNVAFTISAADTRKVVGVATLVGSYDLGSGRIAQSNSIAIPYDCVGTTLYAALITRAGHTFFLATTDLELTVYVERN